MKSMAFTFKKLQIPDVVLVEPKVFTDSRGFFLESFKESDFLANGITDKFVQDNCSHSVNGVIRGLHYQKPPKSQAKLVTVIKGRIFDVAVDIRKNSPTFGKWVGEILSDDNHRLLYIPEGFAHGFCVLSEESDVIYKVNNEYSKEHEGGLIWNDPTVKISWPTERPIVSDRDCRLPPLGSLPNDFIYQQMN